jgi:hypothetical protein
MVKSLLLAAALGLVCAGCGGLSASKSFSPLMFFLPGLGQAKPAPSPSEPSTLVASNRDLSLVN